MTISFKRKPERTASAGPPPRAIGSAIEDLDSQISRLQEAMEATNDAAELMESQQQIDQLTAAQEEAMLEWEELAEKV